MVARLDPDSLLTRWLLPGAALVFCAALVAALATRFGGLFMASDDAYIYLGYVKSFVTRGEIFSYNPGEYSPGATGLLYLYLLSAAGAATRLVYWPDAGRALALCAFALNAVLFVGFGALLARTWGRLSNATGRSLVLEQAILFMLVVANTAFVWGWFGGLENPLAAMLCMWIFERFLARAAPWQIALLAAALGCTRPELLPFGVLLTALAVIDARAGLLRGAATMSCFAACVGALVLPSRLLTGEWTPSALGARVEIAGPTQWFGSFMSALASGYLWKAWVAGSLALLAAAWAVPRDPERPAIRGAATVLAGYFAFRAIFDLVAFNVADRYVSFLWPLYPLLALALARRSAWWQAAARAPNLALSLALGFAALGSIAAGVRAERELAADTEEMNQVVVTPARWMAANLPAGSRIAMEPAGAIRVFTDFYLVDLTGLTTTHLEEFKRTGGTTDFAHFVSRYRLSHVFVYPDFIWDLRRTDRFQPLQSWTPHPQRNSIGTIAVYGVIPDFGGG